MGGVNAQEIAQNAGNDAVQKIMGNMTNILTDTLGKVLAKQVKGDKKAIKKSKKISNNNDRNKVIIKICKNCQSPNIKGKQLPPLRTSKKIQQKLPTIEDQKQVK